MAARREGATDIIGEKAAAEPIAASATSLTENTMLNRTGKRKNPVTFSSGPASGPTANLQSQQLSVSQPEKVPFDLPQNSKELSSNSASTGVLLNGDRRPRPAPRVFDASWAWYLLRVGSRPDSLPGAVHRGLVHAVLPVVGSD